jgi:hypothetical protein
MNETILEKMVLGEIAGKNKAIHAYDEIAWKIRTGFLTLLFGGWGVFLRSTIDAKLPQQEFRAVLISLALFSAGFAYAAWSIDRSYLRRKFRVILVLDQISVALAESGGDVTRVSPDLLRVAGDDALKPYDCLGFRDARRTELKVYLVPVLIVGVALVFVVMLHTRS